VGEGVEEVCAGDDAGHVAGVDDGDDEYALVQEDLGDLVSEKSSSTSMWSVLM
jgi:hypothetical protein